MKLFFTSNSSVSAKFRWVLVLSVFFLGFFKTSSAHQVINYNVPCFTQGNTVTIGVAVTNTGVGNFFHWQYRATPGGAWVWLANGNNVINGHTFNVTGASVVSTTVNSTPDLVISNVGSPAYTTQLDNVEFRVLMTDALDPETNPSVAIFGGEEYFDIQAKYIRIKARPATENCFSNCSGNSLVINPALVPPPLGDYFGGFEVSGGSATDNFSTPGINGTTSRAATDIVQWTGGPLGATPLYRVINNADSINTSYDAFAPRSGRQMLVVCNNNSASNRVWYRTIAVANPAEYYNGQITFRVWLAKVDATDACMVLEVKGATTQGGSVSSFAGNSITQNVTGTAGTWVQATLSVVLPPNTYKKLEISIHGCNSTPASVAIDDICLLEPAAGVVPVVLTELKGSYSKGVAHLVWGTEQEINSSDFVIEHSTDGQNFGTLGNVSAAGYSSRMLSYKFDDIKANAGANYYRLRMVDKDGQFKYSNTVLVNVNIKGFFVTAIYPSPFVDKVNVSVSSEKSAQATVRIYDITGKVIIRKDALVNKGITTITLDNLGKLSKGLYFVELNSDGIKYAEKLIK